MMKKLSPVTLSLVLLGGAVAIAFVLIATRSTPSPQANGEKSIIVTLAPLEPQTKEMIIEAFGVVRPANEASLQAQISGRVESVHPALRIGGIIPAGEAAVQIEKADFEAAVSAAEAAVARARAALALEEGRRKVAEREAEIIGEAAPDLEIDTTLALREPQLADAKAVLREAQSNLTTAQLNLQRTEIRFPFDALVLNEDADIGDFATVGAPLGAVADVSAFWLEVEIPQSTLQRLRSLAGPDGRKPVARIFPTGTTPSNRSVTSREATVISLSGSVSDQTRLGVALLEIKDPLSRLVENQKAPSILLGSYVDVEIGAGAIDGVYETPVAALRENDKVAVRAKNGRLAIRDVEIIHRQASTALVRGDFESDDELIISRLTNAIPGTLLQTPEEIERNRKQDDKDNTDDTQRVSGRQSMLNEPPQAVRMPAHTSAKLTRRTRDD